MANWYAYYRIDDQYLYPTEDDPTTGRCKRYDEFYKTLTVLHFNKPAQNVFHEKTKAFHRPVLASLLGNLNPGTAKSTNPFDDIDWGNFPHGGLMQDGDALVIWNLGHLSDNPHICGAILDKFVHPHPRRQKFHLIVLKHGIDTSSLSHAQITKGEIHPQLEALRGLRALPAHPPKRDSAPVRYAFTPGEIRDDVRQINQWHLKYNVFEGEGGDGGGDGGGNNGGGV